MLKRTLVAMLTVTLVVAPSVMAQDATTTEPAAPKAKSIITAIPADCTGFLAASSLESMMGNFEVFLGAMGLSETIQGFAPMGVLPMASMMLGMGEGFNPNGGFGIVMVSAEKCGCDDFNNMTADNTPLVFLLAGKDAQSTFGGAVFSDDGKTFELMSVGKMYFKQIGDYVAFTPNPKALELMESEKKVTLKPHQAKVLAKSDLTVFVNWEVVAPMAMKSLEVAENKVDEEAENGVMDFDLNLSKEQIKNIEGMIVGIDTRKAGMTFDIVIDYKAGSTDAKMLAALKGTSPITLNSLPNGKYYIAGGINGLQAMLDKNEELKQGLDMLIDELEIPEDIIERMKKLLKAAEGNLQSMQFFVGKTEKAPLAMAAAIECKDADEILELVPQKVEILNDMLEIMAEKAKDPEKVKAMVEKASKSKKEVVAGAGVATNGTAKMSLTTPKLDDEDLAELAEMKDAKFKVVKNAATIDGVKFDAVILDLSEVKEFDDADRQQLVEVIGEEEIRVLFAKVSKTKIISCFGGGEAFAKQALAAAKGGDSLAKNADIEKAMKVIDGKRVTFAAISLKNIFDVIAKFAPQDEDSPMQMLNFASEEPIIMGDIITGDLTTTSRIFVPISVFKDIFAAIQENMANGGMMPMPGMGGF